MTDKQLTPTASWWFRPGTLTAAPLLRVISLSTNVPGQSSPPWVWSPDREHWGIDPTVGAATNPTLTQKLSTSVLFFTKEASSPAVPSGPLEAEATSFAASWRMQTKAKGALVAGDWTSGPPPMHGGAWFYYEGPTTSDPRLLLELTPSGNDLRRITWLITQATSGFGSTLTLNRKTMLPIPWTGLVHYSVATGLS